MVAAETNADTNIGATGRKRGGGYPGIKWTDPAPVLFTKRSGGGRSGSGGGSGGGDGGSCGNGSAWQLVSDNF